MCFGLETFALLGTLVSGAGAAMGAMQQSAAMQAQAEMHRRQAMLEREKGVVDANVAAKKVRAQVGEQAAAFASNGVDLSSGSALQVITDTGTEGALDVASVRYGARIRSDNEEYQAKVASANAGMAAASAPFAFLSPILSGAPKIKAAFS